MGNFNLNYSEYIINLFFLLKKEKVPSFKNKNLSFFYESFPRCDQGALRGADKEGAARAPDLTRVRQGVWEGAPGGTTSPPLSGEEARPPTDSRVAWWSRWR